MKVIVEGLEIDTGLPGIYETENCFIKINTGHSLRFAHKGCDYANCRAVIDGSKLYRVVREKNIELYDWYQDIWIPIKNCSTKRLRNVFRIRLPENKAVKIDKATGEVYSDLGQISVIDINSLIKDYKKDLATGMINLPLT